jgi:hypothetical protein
MRKPCRLKIAVGRFDQRLRCASSLKSKTTLPRWASSSVARNFFVAATIPAVGAPGVEFVWAKLFNPAPNNRIKTTAIFWFIAKLNRNPCHGSIRTKGSSNKSETMEVALDSRIAAGHGTLVSDVALSLSDWDVSSGPYACLSQMRLLGRDLAKATPKLVELPELVADRIITFAEIVGQENVIAGTDCGLGGRVHPQIAWAKLRALRDGAAIASKKLWS